MDKPNLETWVGRDMVAEGCITSAQAAQIHATLGEGDAPRAGDPLPLLWHWCAFPTLTPTGQLKEDGHGAGTGLLPPVWLPRRMWAGGALTFHQPLRVDEPFERRSRVRGIQEKAGKTGPMILVTLDHDLVTANGVALQESQDIVYLDIPDSFTPPQKRPLPAPVIEEVATPETLLFRYSALTFNAHRIHYDLAYSQQVEKYPGLVVHGPMQATFLMRAAMRKTGRAPIYFDFRGVHPMFAGPNCDIATEDTDEGLRLWTGQNGHQCMQARATWEGTV